MSQSNPNGVNSTVKIDMDDVIEAYSKEVARLTNRAVMAETGMLALQERLTAVEEENEVLRASAGPMAVPHPPETD